jgi:hypothetical protein
VNRAPFEYSCERCGYATRSRRLDLTTCEIPLTSWPGMIPDEATPRCGGDLWPPYVCIDALRTDPDLHAQLIAHIGGPVEVVFTEGSWRVLFSHDYFSKDVRTLARKWVTPTPMGHHRRNPTSTR